MLYWFNSGTFLNKTISPPRSELANSKTISPPFSGHAFYNGPLPLGKATQNGPTPKLKRLRATF